ncbi:hypothetical protein ETU08_00520 [Apibacter muscae]|uniref:hypothetical protein n=1 Tax=Apibacter muscae TaxID=2509004 RepID=UPI0011AD1D1C|nr:hypothetical protein [Apibacter muscae]TWP31593.1 hypothetical protein ETU08_00520 [Apibacter muscae]
MSNANFKSENLNNNLNPESLKVFLTALDNFSFIGDYQQLGFSIQALIKALKVAILDPRNPLNRDEFFLLLSLLLELIPSSEWELLDKLNKN